MTARLAMRPGVTTVSLPCPRCGRPVLAVFGYRDDGQGHTRCELTQVTQRCACKLSASDVEAALGAKGGTP